jgi:putative sigma-54 modulation protein
MNLKITGRHMEITPALQQYVETRFGRLDRYGLKLGAVQVVLGVEKLQHKAEVVCAVNGKRVQAKTATREMYATIDALVDRLDAQLRKRKDRLVSHKPNTHWRPKLKAPGTPLRDQRGRRVVERRIVPVLSIEEAQEQLAASTLSFMVFMNEETGVMQVVERLSGGRMAVIEPYAEESVKRGIPSGALT